MLHVAHHLGTASSQEVFVTKAEIGPGEFFPVVGVGPHPKPWPVDDRLDPELLENGDRRNVQNPEWQRADADHEIPCKLVAPERAYFPLKP